MENKVINLQINSNFDATEQQVKSLGTAIKVLDTEATNLDATFEEVYGDLKPLTARMGEAEDRLYELAKAGKQSSQEYKDLLSSVASYKKVQQQTDLVVDAASQTMGSKMSGSLNAAAGGFSLVQGSMALFGAESSSVEQAMLKVQSAMAISQGVETINQGAKSVAALGESAKKYTIVQKIVTAGQYLWNNAIKANPIMAIVTGIIALIAAGVALYSYFKSSSEAAAKNTAAVKANEKALENQTKTLERNSSELQKKQSQQLAMAKASGASASAIRALELKLIDEKIAYEKSARAIAFNTYEKNKNKLASLQAAGADADVIKKQTEVTNESVKQVNKQNENIQKAFDERKAIQNRHQVEVRQSQTDHNKQVQTKSNDEATKKKQDAEAEAKRLKEEAAKNVIAEAESFRNKLEEIEKIERDAKKANADALLTEEQLAIQNEDLAYKAKLDNAIKFGVGKEAIELQHNNNLKAIKNKFALEDDAKKVEEYDKIISDQNATSEAKIAAIDAEQALFQSQFDKKLITEKEYNDKTKKLSESRVNIDKAERKAKADNIAAVSNLLGNVASLLGESTAAGKAAAVAQATISTYQAAQSAYASLVGVPVVGPALAAVAAGVAVAGGIANVQKILSVETPGGGGGGGGGSVPTAAAVSTPPNFNVVGASSTNQLAQTIGNQQNTPVQAYVVSNDVSTAQALERNIVKGASLG